MTIGELADRAVTLLVRRWRGALTIAFVAWLPAALYELALLLDVKAPFLVLTLRALEVLGQIYGIAALVALFAGRDAGAAVREGWLRLLRTAVFALVPLVATMAVGSLVLNLVAMVAVHIGHTIGALTVVACTVTFFAIMLPVVFVTQLAIANSVLDGTRATTSVLSAYQRAFAAGERHRTALLSYAAAALYALPTFVVGGAVQAYARSTDIWWPVVVLPPLHYAAAATLYAAVISIAAQDYAIRHEGRDLESMLDGLEAV